MPISTRNRTKLGLSNMDNIIIPKQNYSGTTSDGEPPMKKIKNNTKKQGKKNKENSKTHTQHSNETKISTKNNNLEDVSTTSTLESSSADNLSTNSDNQLLLKEHHTQLKKVLSQEYVDIVKRLKLNFIPHCVGDMYFCKNNHSKECPRPSVASPYVNSQGSNLISENRALHFLKMVEDLCNRTYFMSSEVFSLIFELILTINPAEDHIYTSNYVIHECESVFDKLITTFPPCWQQMHKFYDTFLTSPIKTSKFISGKSESNATNILTFIITMLDETINLKENDTQKEKDNEIDDVNKENESDFFNFHEWESRHCNVHSLDSHSREEKLDRLFLTLHLLTKLLELDLSLWMLRYINRPSKHIFTNAKPLIVNIFEMNEFIQLTDMVKKVLNIFVICISFGYPVTKINILSRLVSLLSVVINLTETESAVQGVIYPKIGAKTETYAREIMKSIENCVGVSINKYLLIIENINIPYIKYLLIDHLLTKLNPHSGQMCPKKIFENFTKRWWTKCGSAPKDMIQDNGKVCRTNAKNTLGKYPIIENIQNKNKSSEIYREEYLHLLLEALISYCEVHATKKFALILMNKKNVNIEAMEQKKRTNNKRSNSPISAKLNLEKLEKDIEKLVKKVNYQEESLFTEIELPVYDNVFIDSDTMIKYNEDIKYMMRLKKNIPLMKDKFGIEFNNWNTYINQFFEVMDE